MRAYHPYELAGLTFNSFRFSQGDVFIQPQFINYIVAKERDRIEPDALELSHAIARARTAHFIQRADLHKVSMEPKGTRTEDHATQMEGVKKMWDEALRVIEPDDAWLATFLLRGGIVARDHKYLVEQGGRPRVAAGKTRQEHAATYLSHTIHYGILAKTTGQPIYDELFADVTLGIPDYWSNYISSEDRRAKGLDVRVGVLGALLTEVANVHFSHYPEDAKQIPPEWQAQLMIAPAPLSEPVV